MSDERYRESVVAALAALEKRQVITTDPAEAETCCGIPRDEDGFCVHRPGHPIYVRIADSF